MVDGVVAYSKWHGGQNTNIMCNKKIQYKYENKNTSNICKNHKLN